MIDLAALLSRASNRVLAAMRESTLKQLADVEASHAIVMQRASEIEKEGHLLVEDKDTLEAFVLAIALEQEKRDA